ncbi:hypothetical protein M404DRAFT_441553 [Pisolithus tinctorius Marx 270]|uniref:Uncharacterized protein n=1 Tax=Pisolithus tinctorius Marx 270 TaxID=870435 RepID=A0A0C3P199_PISTI|nr:hypothetical protein M404DRAFT_441553 [Pisolithus tinctorius Marx 270]
MPMVLTYVEGSVFIAARRPPSTIKSSALQYHGAARWVDLASILSTWQGRYVCPTGWRLPFHVCTYSYIRTDMHVPQSQLRTQRIPVCKYVQIIIVHRYIRRWAVGFVEIRGLLSTVCDSIDNGRSL